MLYVKIPQEIGGVWPSKQSVNSHWWSQKITCFMLFEDMFENWVAKKQPPPINALIAWEFWLFWFWGSRLICEKSLKNVLLVVFHVQGSVGNVNPRLYTGRKNPDPSRKFVGLMVKIPSPGHRIGSGKSRILRRHTWIIREGYFDD